MYGVPVTTANGEYTRVTDLPIDAFSREKMDLTLKELEEERAGVASLVGLKRRRGHGDDDRPPPVHGFALRLGAEQPLQVPGAICAYHAILAEKSGFKAIYLSGGGVAAGSLGMPDLGISTLDDVLTDVRRITDVCSLPLLVDVDTGFGASAFNVARTVKSLIKFGAGGDAHRGPGRRQALRPPPEQGTGLASRRWSTASRRRSMRARDPDFVVMARTDALAVEGIDAAIDRARACVEAGADMIFPEAMTELAMYRRFVDAVKVPVLANITEFGATPLFTVDELRSAGVAIALYPLSAFRAMNKAALNVYRTLRHDGTQRAAVDGMQTRAELYEYLGYHAVRSEARRAVRQGATRVQASRS